MGSSTGPAATSAEALADRLVQAIEAGDVDAVTECYDPQIRVWHNFDDAEQDRAENLRTLAWMCGAFAHRRYEIRRRAILDDGLLQQHVLHLETQDGVQTSIPACLILQIRDGRITRIDEYLDPSPLAPG